MSLKQQCVGEGTGIYLTVRGETVKETVFIAPNISRSAIKEKTAKGTLGCSPPKKNKDNCLAQEVKVDKVDSSYEVFCDCPWHSRLHVPSGFLHLPSTTTGR